jgi:hypothetical protein
VAELGLTEILGGGGGGGGVELPPPPHPMVPRIKEQARTTPQTMRIKMSILRLSIKPSYLVKSRFDPYWYEKFTPELDSTFRVVAGMRPEVV